MVRVFGFWDMSRIAGLANYGAQVSGISFKILMCSGFRSQSLEYLKMMHRESVKMNMFEMI